MSTNITILIVVLVYELASILGISWYINLKSKKRAASGERAAAGEFILGGRSLPWYVIAVTMALTVLGAPHIFGLLEMSYNLGAVAVWFGLAHVALLVVATLCTANWVRRANVSTMPEMLSTIFGNSTRLLVSCVMPGMIWAILTLECQGVGIVFATITGMSITQGAILGGVLGALYVLLAGMKEIGWVNFINCAVMYVGLIMAFVHLTVGLPGGWGAVEAHYVSENQARMLSIFGTKELFLLFAIPNIIATVTCQSVSQQLIQPAISANDPKGFRKALWLAAPLNGMFGIFIICIGLAAKSNPEFGALGPKMAGTTMLFSSLPPWLVAWIFAAFLGAILSSLAAAVLAPATIFTVDIYKNLYKGGKLGERQEAWVTRVAIVVLFIAAVATARNLPPIVSAMSWLFAWLTPVFVILFLGLFWKRSALAANVTLLACWVVNCLWSFTGLPAAIGMQGIHNVYVTLTLSVVLSLVLQNVVGGKPGLYRDGGAPGKEVGAHAV
ncbi:MAG: sodium:solute symporter family protein [Deltaproteobacteria bacterium]|jgi:SSS family solute:Na+ symporter|nr:sodium:solute symporter family protein [Deltaproteobacteria bacterium]